MIYGVLHEKRSESVTIEDLKLVDLHRNKERLFLVYCYLKRSYNPLHRSRAVF